MVRAYKLNLGEQYNFVAEYRTADCASFRFLRQLLVVADILCCPAILKSARMQKRCFHSGLVSLGRKTGASAFVAESRPLSKKQMKRKSVLTKARAVTANQQKEKTKSQFMEQQIQSMDIDKLISETSAALEGAFQGLMLPDGTPRLDPGNLPPVLEPRELVDPYNVLYSLRDNLAKKDLLLSGNVDSADKNVVGIENSLATVILDQDILNAEAPSEYKMNRALRYFASNSKFKELSEVGIYHLTTAVSLPLASSTSECPGNSFCSDV